MSDLRDLALALDALDGVQARYHRGEHEWVDVRVCMVGVQGDRQVLDAALELIEAPGDELTVQLMLDRDIRGIAESGRYTIEVFRAETVSAHA